MGVSERRSHGYFLQHPDLGAALQCRTATVQAARQKRVLHPPSHHPSACPPESTPYLPHTKAPSGCYPFSHPHLHTRTFAASFLSLLPALNFFIRVSTSISICSTQPVKVQAAVRGEGATATPRRPVIQLRPAGLHLTLDASKTAVLDYATARAVQPYGPHGCPHSAQVWRHAGPRPRATRFNYPCCPHWANTGDTQVPE